MKQIEKNIFNNQLLNEKINSLSELFFDKVYDHLKDRFTDKGFAILYARGFLIEKEKDGYYLSEDASYDFVLNDKINDVTYIFDLFTDNESYDKYFKQIKNNEKISKVNLGKESNINRETLMRLYEPNDVLYSYTLRKERFGRYSNFIKDPIKAPVYYLSPFISLFVKSLSLCGLHITNAQVTIDMDIYYIRIAISIEDDYDKIFLKQIYDKLSLQFKINHRWTIINNELCLELDVNDLDSYYDIYFEIFQFADYITQNIKIFRDIKRTIKEIKQIEDSNNIGRINYQKKKNNLNLERIKDKALVKGNKVIIDCFENGDNKFIDEILYIEGRYIKTKYFTFERESYSFEGDIVDIIFEKLIDNEIKLETFGKDYKSLKIGDEVVIKGLDFYRFGTNEFTERKIILKEGQIFDDSIQVSGFIFDETKKISDSYKYAILNRIYHSKSSNNSFNKGDISFFDDKKDS